MNRINENEYIQKWWFNLVSLEEDNENIKSFSTAIFSRCKTEKRAALRIKYYSRDLCWEKGSKYNWL